MKSPLLIILIVAIVSVAVIAGVFASGILASKNPSVSIVGVSPSNHSSISDVKPAVTLNLTVQNVKADSLSFMLFIDGINRTGSVTVGPTGVQFSLPMELGEGIHIAQANVSFGQAVLASPSWDFRIDATPPPTHCLEP